MEAIPTILAHDHPWICAGVRALLTETPDINLVGETANCHEALRPCRSLRPEVALIRLHLMAPFLDWMLLYLRDCCPDLKVLVIVNGEGDADLERALTLGVTGCLSGQEDGDMLAQAIRTVATGGSWLSPSVVHRLAEYKMDEPSPTPPSPLTGHERQVLDLVARGRDNRQIAAELHLAGQTVRNYVSRIYGKLGVRSRPEAMIWAGEHGFGREHQPRP